MPNLDAISFVAGMLFAAVALLVYVMVAAAEHVHRQADARASDARIDRVMR